MAIQFDPNALSAFSNVNFGRDDAIANLSDDKKGLVHNGDRGFGIFAKLRSTETQAKNNVVRTELLKALGRRSISDSCISTARRYSPTIS